MTAPRPRSNDSCRRERDAIGRERADRERREKRQRDPLDGPQKLKLTLRCLAGKRDGEAEDAVEKRNFRQMTFADLLTIYTRNADAKTVTTILETFCGVEASQGNKRLQERNAEK